MRKDQLRTYKSKRDANIKLLSSRQQAIIKDKRAKLRKTESDIIAKQKKLVEGKRNYGNISNRQVKKFKKKISKNVSLKQKYKYANNKGDIAFGKVIDQEGWIDNFASSNVFKFKRVKNNLQVMFLDGSVYLYFGVGKLFIGLLNAGSKGKWVWRELRDNAINYVKIR